ncbi:hypothetical protein Deipr_2409 (plasmid) [Deinococcus proteolyticus MRP]|uniref:Uncharacterized protein n=1 Tax=Deinococcus proteolyticus (strain ATCC 35074 / DSM 20540 / JCM 6276 / NBRC 101906 / NCIMB 13154 / VKM Ac-1939 / CCM 2703 / MRP) TaxID=693977 RepID=F0RQH4_DEIPM|nr:MULTISPECIES: hypothetical protein [Deinococcus]ADY27533.1 hypothetical protein Deipr_2409 [Deinococcus proteolyticus MRP]MCY1704379.1 hypothetical protein [Deinococcus sp. SL84]
MKAITLKQNPHCRLPEPTHDVLLYGKKVGTVYHNLTGYVGLLPTADGRVFDPGEKGITSMRRLLPELNREWAAAEAQAADPAAFHAQQQAAFQGKLVP